MTHLFQPLLDRAARDAGAPFCTFVGGGREVPVSAGDMIAAAAAVGRALLGEGAARGSIVLIVLEHCEQLYSAFAGAVLVGAVPSFMSPLTRKQDPTIYHASLRTLIERIQPSAIITSKRAAASIPGSDVPLLFVDRLPAADEEAIRMQAARAARLHAGDTAFLQHSSGTTGLKKGVMLSHEAVLTQCRLYARAIGMEAGDTVVSWLPLYHDMGLITCFLLPAILGAPIVSLDAMEWVMRPTMLLQRIEQHHGRYAWLPNFAFHHIARLDTGKRSWDLSSLKALVSCSEPCRAATFESFLHRYRSAGLGPEKLHVSYALAENVFAATHTPVGQAARPGRSARTSGFVSCGTALAETEFRICSEDGTVLGKDEIGEIWLRSPCLFEGYFRQPDLTARKLEGGWYRTGDLGTVEDDELFVVGRLDDLLIVNGKNLLAHEVEDVLNAVPGLIPGRILVHGRFDDEIGTAELVVLAERDEPQAECTSLKAAIRSMVYSLSGVYPTEIVFLEPGFLVKTSSGKIARAASFDKFSTRGRHG